MQTTEQMPNDWQGSWGMGRLSMTVNTSEFDHELINPLHTKELIRIGELLNVLPFGRTTIWEWAKKGQFPAPIKIHGTTVWKCREVLAWVDTHQQLAA